MEYINPITAFGGFDVRNDEMIVEGERADAADSGASTGTTAPPLALVSSIATRRSSGFPAWIIALGVLAFILALSSERSR